MVRGSSRNLLLNLQSKLTTPRRLRSVVPGLLLAAALATTALAATAGALEPFAAEYRASYMGLSASGSMTLEPQGSERWKYSLKVTHPIAQLTQITLFEDAKGQWRPLSGSDISLLLTKEIRRHAVYDWAVGQARWSGDVKPERAGPVALQQVQFVAPRKRRHVVGEPGQPGARAGEILAVSYTHLTLPTNREG